MAIFKQIARAILLLLSRELAISQLPELIVRLNASRRERGFDLADCALLCVSAYCFRQWRSLCVIFHTLFCSHICIAHFFGAERDVYLSHTRNGCTENMSESSVGKLQPILVLYIYLYSSLLWLWGEMETKRFLAIKTGLTLPILRLLSKAFLKTI